MKRRRRYLKKRSRKGAPGSQGICHANKNGESGVILKGGRDVVLIRGNNTGGISGERSNGKCQELHQRGTSIRGGAAVDKLLKSVAGWGGKDDARRQKTRRGEVIYHSEFGGKGKKLHIFRNGIGLQRASEERK